jgi:hypothetical protein
MHAVWRSGTQRRHPKFSLVVPPPAEPADCVLWERYNPFALVCMIGRLIITDDTLASNVHCCFQTSHSSSSCV